MPKHDKRKLKKMLKWSNSAANREEHLFTALSESGQKIVKKSKLKKSLLNSGLRESDYRIKNIFQLIEQSKDDDLSFDSFCHIIRSSGLLVEKALRGDLIIPDFKHFSNTLDAIFDEVKNNKSGELASYIPPLAKVNPEQFGIAIVTTDGQVYQRGDSSVDFSIQSMCKPFNYCFAIEKLGLEAVHRHVGQEPSGRFFNDLSLLSQENDTDTDQDDGKVPFNPMINAGAIMTASLINNDLSNSQRLYYVRQQRGRLIGWMPGGSSGVEIPRFNKEMARQENYKGYNNLALGYLLMGTGKLPHKNNDIPDDVYPESTDEFDFYIEPSVVDALKIYFSICSLEMSALDVAMAAATLANGGVCPLTQDRVLNQITIKNCLPVTQMCGMYNGSGKFFQDIGVPAKSGVGGGIFLVVPQLMGICIFSPKLDVYGNSVRGIEMARKITSKYLVHAFDGFMTDDDRLDPRISISKWKSNSCSESILAASIGDIMALERLSSQQRDLSIGDYDGRTPLHLAAAEGHLDTCKFLIDLGIKPKPDRWGGYPISDAKENNHYDIINLFNTIPIAYTEPCHLVEDADGKTDESVFFEDELLVIELLWSATNNDVNGLQTLLARGVPINSRDYDSRTALHLAAAEGNIESVDYLISHGHPIFVRDRWGATPLDEAKRENRDEVSEILKKFE